jgi:transglutaminase-like putative cysteine protease
MRFRIRHVTNYRYDRPVRLGPHVFRLQPRRDGFLSVEAFALAVHPQPARLEPALDLEGNLVHLARFEGETRELRISFRSAGETRPRPVFAPLLDPAAASLPPAYAPAALADAYLSLAPAPDPEVADFAASAAAAASGNTLGFLDGLNRRLREGFTHAPRLSGPPLDPDETLRRRKGSCRDLAVLFQACCRRQGLASRFVSGYIPATPGDRQHMHAWAEVYLPGAGWCAFDPSQGTVAGEKHVAVAAAADPSGAAPITGVFESAGAQAEMEVELQVETEEP